MGLALAYTAVSEKVVTLLEFSNILYKYELQHHYCSAISRPANGH